jgi:Ca-activated chloride channel family protein
VLTRFFTTPALLGTLAILPVLVVLALWARRRRRTLIARIGPPGVIAGQVERPTGGWRIAFGWTLGLALLSVGAAGPHWGLGPPPPTAPGRDIVVVLDVSRSMLAQDALPSRLDKSKDSLREFADAVQARGGHRLALVAFAGQAAVICPLTNDYDHFRAKLAALSADPPPSAVRGGGVSGTRIGAGLRRAVDLLDPQLRAAEEIVLVSDGDDPVGDEEWRVGLAAAREAGVLVDTVGVGDPNADSPIPTDAGRLRYQGADVLTRLHEPPLREIAARTGGVFVTARTGPLDIAALFRERIASAPTREAAAGTLPQPIGRQALFFALALTFIMGTMLTASPWAAARGSWQMMKSLLNRIRRPATVVTAFALVSATPPADWLRRGNDELSRGQPAAALAEYARAAERTTDPGVVAFNEGVALFRLGRFREAEQHFRRSLADATGGRRVRALYNLGAALVQESQGRRAGPLKSAVASFEQALEIVRRDDPLADDVRHNLELAKRLLATARAANPNQPDEPPDSPEPHPPAPSPGTGDEPGTTQVREPTPQPGQDGKAPGKADGNKAPQLSDKSPPGKGHLPPLPDEDVLSPLTPEDAAAHLERATERIAAERRARLKRTAPGPSTKFREW